MMKKSIVCQGRRKTVMAKISNQSNLQVTFSKRRSGIFKKASDLCLLCGIEIIIVVFSPTNKVFSFGHPNVDFIVDRFFIDQKNSFLNYNFNQMTNINIVEPEYLSSKNGAIQELNMKLRQLLGQFEDEKKKGEEINNGRSKSCLWESSEDGLSLGELELLKASLEELKDKVNVTRQAHKIENDHLISTAHFSQFSMMNGVQSSNIVFDNKWMDDLVARNSASTSQEAHDFGFGNEIF